jgi:predicted transcriptional regulator
MSDTPTSVQTSKNDSFEDELSKQLQTPHLEILKVLDRVGSKIARGPAPAFNEAHTIKTIEIIQTAGIVGRISLSNSLNLGIGTTRTILKHLKNEGLIESSKYGFLLSEQGKQVFKNLRDQISRCTEVPKCALTVGPVVVAVLVKDMAHKVGRGIEQRNTAIRAGASGATTLVFSGKKIVMPSRKNHAIKGLSEIQAFVVSDLDPKDNDVVIFGSGEDKTTAEIGAIMAAIKLLRK